MEGHADQLGEWCAAWDLDSEQRQRLFFACYELFVACGQPARALALLKTGLSSSSSAPAPPASVSSLSLAARAASLALALPDQYVFDELLALPAVAGLAASSDASHRGLHALLVLVTTGSVADFEAFAKANADLLTSLQLSGPDLLAKMRLLALASAAADTPVLPYADAAKALGVPDDGAPLESWIIRAMSGDSFRESWTSCRAPSRFLVLFPERLDQSNGTRLRLILKHGSTL
jgi:hypothetical protein